MGILYIVATPIGNLSDMTYRAVEILKTVKYIAAEDTRHVIPLLKRYTISANLLISLHKYNEYEKCSMVLDKIKNENCDIALVSDAGTPCISDPGTKLVALARERNINVIGIPGASAAILAASISGLDTAHFAFLGFFPRDSKNKKIVIEQMKSEIIKTFIIYESPLRIIKTLACLAEHFPHAVIMIGNDLTKMFEYSASGPIADIITLLENKEHAEKGEYVIVIEPRYVSVKSNDCLSPEALLVNEMVLGNITLKEAVKSLAVKSKTNKQIVYKASLHLKKIFGLKT